MNFIKNNNQNFQESANFLKEIFDKNDFAKSVKESNKHASKVMLERFNNGTEIYISFPGYKSRVSANKITYDYRVDIEKNKLTTSLSHANIITDIFNKITNGNMSGDNLRGVLIELAQNGRFEINEINKILPYTSITPQQALIDYVKRAHGNKQYNKLGNSFDLTIEELMYSIKWIVLQEDINYPIAKNYEGRKMPFSRYLETIFVTKNKSYELKNVISRALSHYRPNPWPEMDYSFNKLIK